MNKEKERKSSLTDSANLSEFIIPVNDEAERDLISILVGDPAVMEKVYTEVVSSDFHLEAAGEVYTLMRDLYNKGKRWSLSTLMTKNLSSKGKEILYNVPEGLTYHISKDLIESVKNMGLGRRIFKELYDLMRDNVKLDNRSKVISKALQVFAKLSQRTISDDETKTDVLMKHKKLMVSRYDGGETGIPTGFQILDKMFGQGMRRSNLIILGARPSVGKTSLSLTMAYNAAKAGKKVLYVTVEMNADEIMDKLVAFETGLPVSSLVRGRAGKKEVSLGYKRLLNLPLTVKDCPDATTGMVYAMAVREKATNGLDLVVVDYLGILKDPTDKGTNEVGRIGSLMVNLKLLARMLNVVVVTPHQLSRRVEQRSKESQGSPLLSDLRDSGRIEEAADVVMFLTRKNLLSPEASLHISKHRTGSTGMLDLRFNPDTTRFTSL